MTLLTPEFLLSAAVLIGLCVGSFLNVVIYRLPVMMQREWECECRALLTEADAHDPSENDVLTPQQIDFAATTTIYPDPSLQEMDRQEAFNLAVPRSRCGNCGTQITALQNIPVLSWLALRGRCAACGTKISARYPLIEAFTGLLTVLIVMTFGPTWSALGALGLSWSLIALAMIDYDTQLLPDKITLPLMWGGILMSLVPDNSALLSPDLQSSVIGAVAGYLALWSVYQIFRKLTGKEGMGYGDFKLLAALGAWLGWQALPLIVLLSAVVGSLVGIALIVFKNRDRSQPIPYGPYLAGAGLLVLLWGSELGTLLQQLLG